VRSGSLSGAACITIALAAATLHTQTAPAPRWTSFATGSDARLRGLSAVSDRVVWASGSAGTILRTENGGKAWSRLPVPDGEKLDFRDIDAVSGDTAYALSIGSGEASRIYKTVDAGATWTLQFRNDDPNAFFDAMVFGNARTGYALSDSIAGRMVLFRTTDGRQWTRVDPASLPAPLPGEGAYAASGTNLAMQGNAIWFATTASRVIRSADGGRTWNAAETALPTSTSAGIFSIAFRNPQHGLVVGGDYKKEGEAIDNAAISSDGGVSWTLVRGLGGFRSAVAFVPSMGNVAIAVGPNGSDYSSDGGRTWRAIAGPGFHTLSVARGARSVWAAGEKGTVARLDF
jgi:photosystem II stability/assembly factor-like uncharacterized protein